MLFVSVKRFQMKDNWLVLDPPRLQFSHLFALLEHPVTVCMQWIRQFQFKLNCYAKFVALWFRWKELCDFVSATVYFVNQWAASLCDLSHLHRHGVACLCTWQKRGGKQVSPLSQCDKLCGTVKQKNKNLNVLELCYCFNQIWLSNVKKLH